MLQMKMRLIESQRISANIEKMKSLFAEAGWKEDHIENMLLDDLHIIGKSISDLPYPNISYLEDDRYDFVDQMGKTLLPASEIPMSNNEGYSIIRPEAKKVWYQQNWFIVDYFHDGSVVSVEKLENKNG